MIFLSVQLRIIYTYILFCSFACSIIKQLTLLMDFIVALILFFAWWRGYTVVLNQNEKPQGFFNSS